ncbi:pentapeptide repeat-containing protein [Vitiosangium sp. GDMCC 1.1324]|uniref:pentapeptide repeat-containing protein n=1 Tax=Vitiosangium sp. (strain GDMCC 1.1324) TaxID=2138576 RepID=UPI000D3DC50B|nr:hypothetical protein DAT35_13380 [Vitiosangium sp. GDMCC 1.1324]
MVLLRPQALSIFLVGRISVSKCLERSAGGSMKQRTCALRAGARWYTRPLLLIAAIVPIVSLLACILFLPTYIVERDLGSTSSARLEPAEIVKAKNDVRTTLLQAMGGAVLLATAYFSWRGLKNSREGQLTERFTRAIEHIGRTETDIRLGGIHALSRIGRDSRVDRAAITNILAAYIRGHSLRKQLAAPKVRQHDVKSKFLELPSLQARAPDVQAAMTALTRRILHSGHDEIIELERVDLRRIALHDAWLEGARLEGIRLEGARLEGIRLVRAHLEGAHLEGAYLKDIHLEGAYLEDVHLEGAHLEGAHLESVHLEGAHLEGAHLEGAHLQRIHLQRAYLQCAQLRDAHIQRADLWGAHLEGANLQRAHLEGANLQRAHLEGANLQRAHLEGTILWGAQLQGTILWGAQLQGATLYAARADELTQWPTYDFDHHSVGVTIATHSY